MGIFLAFSFTKAGDSPKIARFVGKSMESFIETAERRLKGENFQGS